MTIYHREQIADEFPLRFHLGVEFHGCAGAFLGTGGICLGHFVHLSHGRVDLADPLVLFF